MFTTYVRPGGRSSREDLLWVAMDGRLSSPTRSHQEPRLDVTHLAERPPPNSNGVGKGKGLQQPSDILFPENFGNGRVFFGKKEKHIIQDHEIFNISIGDISKGGIATIRTHVSFNIFFLGCSK